MALPSVELRSASPHFGPSHNLLRHRFRDNSYLAGPIPLPVPGGGHVRLMAVPRLNYIQKYSYHIEI